MFQFSEEAVITPQTVYTEWVHDSGRGQPQAVESGPHGGSFTGSPTDSESVTGLSERSNPAVVDMYTGVGDGM